LKAKNIFGAFKKPQEAVNRALDISGKSKPKVLFFPQPQRTLPVLIFNNIGINKTTNSF